MKWSAGDGSQANRLEKKDHWSQAGACRLKVTFKERQRQRYAGIA